MIELIQEKLRENGYDAWIFADFRGRDYIAYNLLKLDNKHLATRRWFYIIPANGTPIKIVNKIEPNKLDSLPGEKHKYIKWQELHLALQNALSLHKKVIAQYSPNNSIPYVSLIDAGTAELVKSFGVELFSSGDMVSQFEAFIDEAGKQSHIEAGELMHEILKDTWAEVATRINAGQNPTEYAIMCYMRERFDSAGLFWDHGPIVGVNEHAADPHFEPTPENSYVIKEGDLLLIDLFTKKKEAGSIWYDITWMAFVGNTIPEKIQSIWEVLSHARDNALQLVKDRFLAGEDLMGCEIDDAARSVIDAAGYGEYFIHRTGHNISTQLHGSGAHCDNFETNDIRKIIKGSCFSIEPGIYMPDEKIGFRTEIDVFVDVNGKVQVFGPIQKDLVKILD